jgi:hypothetical protein
MAVLMLALAGYAAYRTTQRPGIAPEEAGAMSPMYPASTALALEYAQEIAIEADQEEQDAA